MVRRWVYGGRGCNVSPACSCCSQFSEEGLLWLVFSKSNLLVAQCVDASYRKLERREEGGAEHVEIAGHHKMTVSGKGQLALIPCVAMSQSFFDICIPSPPRHCCLL